MNLLKLDLLNPPNGELVKLKDFALLVLEDFLPAEEDKDTLLPEAGRLDALDRDREDTRLKLRFARLDLLLELVLEAEVDRPPDDRDLKPGLESGL